jgi:hypothetical protein
MEKRRIPYVRSISILPRLMCFTSISSHFSSWFSHFSALEFVPKLLVCDWLHSVGQNHFYVMMLFIQGCCFIQSLHFSYELQEDSVQLSKQCSSVPFHPSEQRGIPSKRSSIKVSSVRTMRTFRPDIPLSRSFELFSIASIRTSQQHVWTPFCVRQVKGFLSKKQIWEDSYNRPDDVVFQSKCYP